MEELEGCDESAEGDIVGIQQEDTPVFRQFPGVGDISEVFTKTIKDEPEERDVKGTTSCVVKKEILDIKEEVLPVSFQFPFVCLKSEVGDKLKYKENMKNIKNLSNPGVDKIAEEMCSEEQLESANKCEIPSKTLHQTALLGCNVCNKEFSAQTDLSRHRCVHEVYVSESSNQGKYYSEDLIADKDILSGNELCQNLEHNEKIPDENHLCNLCGKLFRHYGRFYVHTKSCARILPYSCNICGKAFNQKCHFKDHMNMHNGKKPFSCSVCDKSFSQKGHLNEHMNIHNGIKRYACDVCGKLFSHKSYFDVHVNMHVGNRPYSCIVCSKSFTYRSSLNRHVYIHTGMKPFSCDICGKSYTQKSNLKAHLKFHYKESQ